MSKRCERLVKTFKEPDQPLSTDALIYREKEEIRRLMESYLFMHDTISFHMIVHGKFSRLNTTGKKFFSEINESSLEESEEDENVEVVESNDDNEIIIMPLTTTKKIFLKSDLSNLNNYFADVLAYLNHRVDTLELEGSNFTLDGIVSLSLCFSKVTLAGGKGQKKNNLSIDDLFLREQRHIIDVPSPIKNGCFLTSIAQHFNPPPDDITEKDISPGGEHYKQTKNFIMSRLKRKNIKLPFPVDKIRFFEEQNAHLSLAICVFMLDFRSDPFYSIREGEKKWSSKKKLVCIYKSNNRGKIGFQNINLLLTKFQTKKSQKRKSAASTSARSKDDEEDAVDDSESYISSEDELEIDESSIISGGLHKKSDTESDVSAKSSDEEYHPSDDDDKHESTSNSSSEGEEDEEGGVGGVGKEVRVEDEEEWEDVEEEEDEEEEEEEVDINQLVDDNSTDEKSSVVSEVGSDMSNKRKKTQMGRGTKRKGTGAGKSTNKKKIRLEMVSKEKTGKKEFKQLDRSCSRYSLHYTYIKDFDKLATLIKTGRKASTLGSKFPWKSCYNCLAMFSTDQALENHQKMCLSNDPQTVIAPDPGSYTQFKDFHKTVPLPIVGFADFETTQRDSEDNDFTCQTCNKTFLNLDDFNQHFNDNKECDTSYTKIMTKQEPLSYSSVIAIASLSSVCILLSSPTNLFKNTLLEKLPVISKFSNALTVK